MAGGPGFRALGSTIAGSLCLIGLFGCQQVASEGVKNHPIDAVVDETPDAAVVDARVVPKSDARLDGGTIAVKLDASPGADGSVSSDGRIVTPDTAPPPPPPPDAAVSPDALSPDAMIIQGPPGWIGPPLVVAVGQGGRRMVSPDGINWSPAIQDAMKNTVPSKHLTGIAYANGLVVAVGGGCLSGNCDGRLMTFDGANWKEGQLPNGQSWLGDVVYGNGLWVAAGAAGPGISSKDGKTWMKTGSLPSSVRALAYGSVGGTNMFIAVGDNGSRVRSLDGHTWTNLVRDFPGADEAVTLRSVAIGNGVAIAAGTTGRRIRSTNGIDWTDPAAGGADLSSIVFSEKTFLAYSTDGIVHISTDDGRTWTPQTVVNSPGYGITVGTLNGARLFVGARAAAIKTSPNGIAWNTRFENATDLNAINAYTIAGY